MTLTISLKDLLSSLKTKKSLTSMFAQSLLKHFAAERFKLVVVYDTNIRSNDSEETISHSHEEADTLMPGQVLSAKAEFTLREVCVWSPDTDVLILLLDLVSHGRLGAQTQLRFLTGR